MPRSAIITSCHIHQSITTCRRRAQGAKKDYPSPSPSPPCTTPLHSSDLLLSIIPSTHPRIPRPTQINPPHQLHDPLGINKHRIIRPRMRDVMQHIPDGARQGLRTGTLRPALLHEANAIAAVVALGCASCLLLPPPRRALEWALAPRELAQRLSCFGV